ncbi:coiled-coil domain-containing glutamate-rich protein 1 [Physeter macrocephalus]|uniref:Coiled-coil domain-containing glutamate-rich protein 1 n=1 Tax=Physeter macrocephalus TaxID=9755 RepID=A0A2Y9FY19_PHYMC|nr:coiled-coil domain-containing glutamate-rich protein 1 [Physeter catodon]|eukprot:XP_007131210.2 coiled-coil domain-containing glutamate-rich protein 1 [Physeter catodon]
MTQPLDRKEDPLNLGRAGASSAPLSTWSSCHRRRRGAPVYRRWHRYGPKAKYESPRKQPKQQHGSGPWFQPPRRPSWAVYSNWGRWGGPWHPPPKGFRKPPGRVQVIQVYGLHALCLCCCSCWRGPWNPGWARPQGRKKRWGRRGRGLRRDPRRSFQRSPSEDLSTLLRPVNLCRWREPGLRAPRNTTQFIMNQIYEDMRQQEELERQQGALRAQQAQAGGTASPAGSFGNDAPPSGGEEDAELRETLYSFGQNPSLAFSPDADGENQSPSPQLVEEEEKNEEEEECDGKELESEEEGAEAEAKDEEEVKESDDSVKEEEEAMEEEEEGLEEDEPREEEDPLPLEMALSILVGAEEERENFINCTYLNPKQIIP